MMNLYTVFTIVLLLSSSAKSTTFYDDFEDDDISDWEARVGSASWSASNGMVNGSISGSPGVLAPECLIELSDCEITTSCTGVHAFGVMARLTDDNSGVIAYVSPDHDVARIRLVEEGALSETLSSISHDFPSGVFYDLTFSCQDEDLYFLIEVPSTGDSWSFSAVDPSPQSGSFGLLMGSEPSAHWDWIEVEGTLSDLTELSWFTTDDQLVGDGDFCLEPGETIALSVEVHNTSDYPLENAFGILQALNSELQITQNYTEFGNLGAQGFATGNQDFAIFAPLVTPSGETYEMRLTVMADEGYQHQICFLLPVGAGLATDLESDSFGWSWAAADEGWENDWHVSTARNHTPGGDNAFKCGDVGSGDYSNHHYGYLESPYVNFPLNGSIEFWSWLDAQVASSSVALDGGVVQFRRTGEWIDLFPVPSYSHQIASGTSGPFSPGTPVYSGIFDWEEYSAAIPESLAGPGCIRFLFGTDDSGNREGWYIDDILVSGPVSVAEESVIPVQQPFLSVSSNPVGESVIFSCFIPGNTAPVVEVRDISGRVVSSLPASFSQGLHSAVWETTSLPSGVYFAVLRESGMEPVKLVKF